VNLKSELDTHASRAQSNESAYGREVISTWKYRYHVGCTKLGVGEGLHMAIGFI